MILSPSNFNLQIVYYRPKRFTLKAFKRYWFTCRDLRLRLYKSREDANNDGQPIHDINLRGCEVTPEVSLTQAKFGIKLEVPSSEGMSEMYIRCDSVSLSCLLLVQNFIK
jgi:kindlin 2